MPGTKVVDCDRDTVSFDVLELSKRAVRIRHDGALGDLELQGAWITFRLEQDMLQMLQELQVGKLLGGKVDGDTCSRQACFAPFNGRSTNGGKHLIADRADETHFFGNLDERTGQQQATLRMTPPHQRFGA